MWINRVSATLIDSRIDSEYYEPEVFAHLSKLVQWHPRPMSDFVEDIRSEPPIHTDHYGTEGIHIVSPTNFTDFEINLSNTKKLALQYRSQFTEFLLQPGRLLFALVGDVGHACVVPAGLPESISYRRTANIKLSGIDPHFVSCFLNIPAGNVQLKRMTTGVIQDQVRLEDSAGVLLPTLDADAQKYIGDKVRHAERLRTQSAALMFAGINLLEDLISQAISESDALTLISQTNNSLLVSAERIINKAIDSPPRLMVMNHKLNISIGVETLGDRLDASFYTEEALGNERRLRAMQARPLGSMICPQRSGYGVLPDSREYLTDGGNGVPLIRGGDLAFGDIRPSEIFIPHETVSERAITREDDVLLLIKGACIDKADGVGFVRAKDANHLFNGSCYRIASTNVDAGFLVGYFQSSAFLIQKRREIANTGISYNSEDSIRSYLVPRFTSAIEQYVGQLVRESLELRHCSAALILAAKHFVEGLIEGRVIEADLIGAQRALENNERTLDRKMLSRVSAAGVDVMDRLPLFHDIDSLYATIEESLRAESSIGDAS